MEKNEIKQILEIAGNNLTNLKLPEMLKFKGSKNTFEELKEKFNKDWTNVIYIFSTQTLPSICSNIETIKARFEVINSKSRCMPRINEDHWKKQNRNTYYLYVGSCKAKTHERMNDHLCNKANTTYALHLNEWWAENDEVSIDILVFGDTLTDHNSLQLIEDIIWQDCKPLFGKRGHK